MIADFSLKIGSGLILHDSKSVGSRDKHAAFAAAYFGGKIHRDLDVASEIVKSSAPIISVIGPNGAFGTELPNFLRATNGLQRRADDPKLIELATALLECLGLLRKQRRVFVSYRRVESRGAAMQIHDLMTARGFDVFLDTHDIRPGDPFQDVLWHRLCDSDVMVMLDTPSYFNSRWTAAEIGRAMAKEIHVLRVIWPGHTPTRLTALADTFISKRPTSWGRTAP
jgi:hypothetical protein